MLNRHCSDIPVQTATPSDVSSTNAAAGCLNLLLTWVVDEMYMCRGRPQLPIRATSESTRKEQRRCREEKMPRRMGHNTGRMTEHTAPMVANKAVRVKSCVNLPMGREAVLNGGGREELGDWENEMSTCVLVLPRDAVASVAANVEPPPAALLAAVEGFSEMQLLLAIMTIVQAVKVLPDTVVAEKDVCHQRRLYLLSCATSVAAKLQESMSTARRQESLLWLEVC